MTNLSSSFRYEVKNKQKIDINSLIGLIKSNPEHFIESYPPRNVNSIYFDDENFNSYKENIDGNPYREKFRIRWYGEIIGKINLPKLEIKIKRGQVGTKKVHQLKDFILNDSLNKQYLLDLIQLSNICQFYKIKLKAYRPVVITSYRRMYYESVKYPIRITVDSDIKYYGIYNNLFSPLFNPVDLLDTVIIEFKFPIDVIDKASKVINHFFFRVTKSSKYVDSINLLYNNYIL